MIKNLHMNTFLMLWPLLLNTCSYSGQQPDSFPFEYREIYLPETARGDDEQLYLNSVDRDWGIWGHNLSAVLPENPSPSVYARVGNGVNRDQFCRTEFWSLPDALELNKRELVMDPETAGSERVKELYKESGGVKPVNRPWWKFW